MTTVYYTYHIRINERKKHMPNKRAPNKEGIAIAIDKQLKDKWKIEAIKQGLTLTDYIIKQVEANYEQENKVNNSKSDSAKSKRNG